MAKRPILTLLIVLICVPFLHSAETAPSGLYGTLQTVFYHEENDFREYTSSHSPVPVLELDSARPSCQVSVWANNVPMYVCWGDLPLQSGTTWFNSVYNAAKSLQPGWKFRVQSANDSYFLDAGPENCHVASGEGPYVGQCPMHMQAV